MRPTRVRYLVLAWMCLFALLAYLHRSAVAVPAELIEADLGIDKKTMAWVMSAFFWGYALMQVPGGWLADRWGSRLSLFVFVSIWSLAMVAMGLVHGLAALIVFRAVMGIAQAGLFPAAVNSFGKWFPAAERGLPNGLLGAFMMIGGMVSNALVGYLLVTMELTWRQTFWMFGLPGLLFAVWFYVWFRDQPREHPGVNEAELDWIEGPRKKLMLSDEPHRELPRPSVWSLTTLIILFFLCGQHFFRGAGTLFYFSWFPTFLTKTRDVAPEQLGWLSAIPLVGATIGCAWGGRTMDWIYRRTGSEVVSRHLLAGVCMSLCAVLFVIPFWITDPLATVITLTAGAFAAGMGGPAAYVVAIDIGGKSIATIFSIMNMAGNVGAALAPNVVIHWTEWYEGWHSVLVLHAWIYLGAAACWLALAWTAAGRSRHI